MKTEEMKQIGDSPSRIAEAPVVGAPVYEMLSLMAMRLPASGPVCQLRCEGFANLLKVPVELG